MSLDDLAAAARAGDRDAYAQLFAGAAPRVHAVLLASAPQGEVEDLMQDAFLVGWERVATLRRADRAAPWLCGIARNLARAARRRRRPRPLDQPGELAAPAPQGAEAARVLRALRRLRPAYREALAMRLVEDCTVEEIAEATGRTAGSVRVHLSRGRALLRAQLERED